MENREKIAHSQWVLLGLTALFLCLLWGLYLRDRRAAAPSVPDTPSLPVEEAVPPLVNLNTATAEELESLPGIGPKLAQRIVAYRETYGPFAAVEDLMEVSGIGEGKLAEMEGLVTVEETT